MLRLSEVDTRKRAGYLVDGLNATLLAYEGRTLGCFAHQRSNQDLIFAVREEENEEQEGDPVSIAGTSLLNLYTLWPTRTKNYGLKQWIERLGTKTWKRMGHARRLAPSKLWNIWNVHAAPVVDVEEFPTYAQDFHSKHGEFRLMTLPVTLNLLPEAYHDPESLDTRKRKRQEEPSAPSPKRRKLGVISYDPDASAFISASSHVDLLCSEWNRTHSMGFILEGRLLPFFSLRQR